VEEEGPEPLHPGPSSCPNSTECVEEVFSEVRRSKHSATARWHPSGAETRRLSTIRCTFVYQGVATRNGATTREILAHRTGAQPNFACTEF
jgi:hypothetical protein